VIRKGRPWSSGGSHSDGPRDEDDDPFESFDAHDRAAGRGQQRAQSESSQSSASDPSETTYTRSRRTPGEAKPGQDEAKKSQRPARSLKGRALGYLSRREYSRTELARKLKPFVEETDSLDTVLDALEAENWLSDSRFAESLIHRRSSRLGASRILGELKQHAVDQTLVEEAGAQLRETVYVPGRLFSVNAVTAAQVPRLFARNERVLTWFDSAYGEVALVLVGALNVGSMATVWAGDITPAARRVVTTLPPQEISLDKGEELGRFNMGSTVILLFQRDRARWHADIRAGATVKLGQSLGSLQ